MEWSYIAGFFDGEGNIHVNKLKRTVQIVCRMYSSEKPVLHKIKEFLGYGNIYYKVKESKNRSSVYELVISGKANVRSFLKSILNLTIVKKPQIIYTLDNFSFVKGDINNRFDVDKFRSFVTRKNTDKFHKYHTQNFKVVLLLL